jgi:Tfp pilus assembly protein PilO
MSNSLLIRIASEKRALVLPLAIGLLLNVLAYFIVVRPLGLLSAGAADRAVVVQANLRAAERDATAARALVSGKSDADQELQAFYQKVLPANLTGARRMTYPSLVALADKTGVRYEARSTSIDEKDRDSRLGHMSIKMLLQGSYANLRQFVYALERAPEFVIIDDVTLTEVSEDEALALSVSMSTYYRLSDDGR